MLFFMHHWAVKRKKARMAIRRALRKDGTYDFDHSGDLYKTALVAPKKKKPRLCGGCQQLTLLHTKPTCPYS